MERPKLKVFPRNLTAQATYAVPGNPASSRPEDAVANCYPGLELDVRNLDRRFFPGLVFDFVARDDIYEPYTQPDIYGALLRYVDLYDPDLTPTIDLTDVHPADGPGEQQRRLTKQLNSDLNAASDSLSDGAWYLEWAKQGRKRIVFDRFEAGRREPMDGLYVWRIIRGLAPLRRQEGFEGVTISLHCRRGAHIGKHVELHGWRRQFTDPDTGVISRAYQPGEMLQSLCSPWQHDFRDCQCHYWAANRPDIVYGEILSGEPTLPDDAAADPVRAETRLDWMRRERGRELEAAALNSINRNRPFQIDHYQINHEWQHLKIVLNDTEVGETYVPPPDEPPAIPYANLEELAGKLRTELAPRELTLAVEYLYARFSIVWPDDVKGQPPATLYEDAVFMRHYLLLVAASEMQHLRWANQLLWELHNGGYISGEFKPVLLPADYIAGKPSRALTSASVPEQLPALAPNWRWRAKALRPPDPTTLEDFVADEQPGGMIDDEYSRVVATLRKHQREHPVVQPMIELAERILKDGNDHYTHFRDIKLVAGSYKQPAQVTYYRQLRPGTDGSAREAAAVYRSILAALSHAYFAEAQSQLDQASRHIREARTLMEELLVRGEELAKANIGIPFWAGA